MGLLWSWSMRSRDGARVTLSAKMRVTGLMQGLPFR